MYMYMLVAR